MALTEPTPGPTKKINELETQRDEENFIVEADAAWKKGNADKARLRKLLHPCPWWKKFVGRCDPPAGGEE